jgi:hypothetical protein
VRTFAADGVGVAAGPAPSLDRPAVHAARLRRTGSEASSDQRGQWTDVVAALDGAPVDPWLQDVVPLSPPNSDDVGQGFCVTAAAVSLPSAVPPVHAATLPGGRRALLVSRGGEAELAFLPLPWPHPESSVGATVDVFVRDEVDHATPFRASVTVRDPVYGAAISFIASGRTRNAAQIFDDARDMLFDKVDNPLAAAAGAYALISSQAGSGEEPWHAWTENLMGWFPWLPDGAILCGRLMLRDEQSDPDVDRAREMLFAGYSRGIPFFSSGIRWLLTGLTVFADDGDEEAAEMLAVVRRVSLRTDMSQPFTVIRLGQHAS